jgi:hypothetical protein
MRMECGGRLVTMEGCEGEGRLLKLPANERYIYYLKVALEVALDRPGTGHPETIWKFSESAPVKHMR